MKLKQILLFLSGAILVLPQWLFAQSQTVYLPQKPGTYSFYSNIKSKGGDYMALGPNAKALSDYLHQSIPMMNANQGFDLKVTLFGQWDDDYQKRVWNYGVRGELRFDFQLFLKENGKEGKWTIEPPHWAFQVNNTETGHGGMLKEGNEGSFLKELFSVFPLVREIAPGVRYYDCEALTCGGLVVFNPNRPPYWLPVTIREVVKAKLEFYKADENNKMLYEFIKPLVDKMSEAQLNAPAFYGSEDGILNVNAGSEGLQIMRFNPAYWDRTLPPSAIQLITMGYSEYGSGNTNRDEQKNAGDEYLKNNGHPDYASMIGNSLPIKDLPGLIALKKQ